MQKLPVLQSGFVGLSELHFVLPNPIEPSVRQAVIFKDFKPRLTTYQYSESITNLFNRFLANKDVVKDFEFREHYIQAAMECFGDRSFYKWLGVQLDSDLMSGLHIKFLNETMAFIRGKTRRISNVQWINLLEAGPVTKSVALDKEEYKKNIEAIYELVRSKTTGHDSPGMLVSVIQDWTSQKNGFEDFMISSYVFFGKRARQDNVADIGF